MWRLIWNKVPTWHVQHARRIQGPSVCAFCLSNIESVDHISCWCPFAKKVISQIRVTFNVEVDCSFGFHDMLLQIIRAHFSPRLHNLWKITWISYFWMIWQAKNATVHKDQRLTFSCFSVQLWAYVKETLGLGLGYNFSTCTDLHCNNCLSAAFVPMPQRRVISVRWALPPLCFIKINFDGSEIKGQLQGGVVFQNCRGYVESAFAKKMGRGHAYEAEICAAIEGVIAAVNQGWT